jgi:hypothetical protein
VYFCVVGNEYDEKNKEQKKAHACTSISKE